MSNDSVLGQAGLALSAYSGVRDALQDITTSWARLEKSLQREATSSALLFKFAYEKARLNEWCSSMGFAVQADGSIHAASPARLRPEILARLRSRAGLYGITVILADISDILQKAQAEFQALDVVELANMDRFLEKVEQASVLAPPGSDEAPGPDPDSGLGRSVQSHDHLFQLLIDTKLLVEKPATLADKITQAARGTYDRILTHLRHLHDKNDVLEGLLTRAQIDALSQLVPQRMVQERDTVEALKDVIVTSFANFAPRTHIAALDAFLSIQPIGIIEAPAGMEIHEDDLDYLGGTKDWRQRRQVVLYKNEGCLLEWNTDLSDKPASRPMTEKRLGNLALRLRWDQPDSYRILGCCGYVTGDGHKNYGLLYRLPQQFRPGPGPNRDRITSLSEILNSRPVPPLGKRFKLALDLAVALSQFQTCQWLHEGISSSNIIFMVGAESSRAVLERPYITGFDFSRHILADSESRGTADGAVYVHPLRRATDGMASMRFRGEFDIYAFGRVLLDIAKWRLVETEHGNLQDELVKLPGLVGDIYSDVVTWCLGINSTSPVHQERIQGDHLASVPTQQAWPRPLSEGFNDNVMRPLCECRA